MTQQYDDHDSHTLWLQDDVEYRKEFGSENAKLEMAEAFVNARRIMNLTQSELAELAGTSQAYIARLESGEANPTIGNVGKLFACMWLSPSIGSKPMEPFESLETAVIFNLGSTKASVERPPGDSAYYGVRING